VSLVWFYQKELPQELLQHGHFLTCHNPIKTEEQICSRVITDQ